MASSPDENTDPNVGHKYYDNDTIIDSSETMRRWNVEKLADPSINNSKMNYRLRVFKETNPPKIRIFRPGIFMEEHDHDNQFKKKLNIKKQFKSLHRYKLSGTVANCPRFKMDAQNENQNPLIENKIKTNPMKPLVDHELEATKLKIKDQTDYETRLKSIEARREEAVKSLYQYLNEQIAQLKDSYACQIQICDTNTNFQSNYFLKNNLRSLYNESLGELEFSYERDLKLIKTAYMDEKNAMVSLYESGKYKKGKLSQYTTLEVFQPQSKRRRYDDNGHRKLLLTKQDAQNVLIEDEIYNFIYGKP